MGSVCRQMHWKPTQNRLNEIKEREANCAFGVSNNFPLCCTFDLESSRSSYCYYAFQSFLMRMIKDLEHVYVSTSHDKDKSQLATKRHWRFGNVYQCAWAAIFHVVPVDFFLFFGCSVFTHFYLLGAAENSYNWSRKRSLKSAVSRVERNLI